MSPNTSRKAAPEHRSLLPKNRKNPLILAMVLQAGGTAKTTTTTILGTILALRGYTVRVFDLDPQCNSSEILGRRGDKDSKQKTVWDLITGECTLDEATVTARYRSHFDEEGEPVFAELPNFYLVHGDDRLVDTDAHLASHAEDFNWFSDLVGRYKQDDLVAHEREVWLLDLPANYGKLTVSTLCVMTEDDDVIPPLLVTGKEASALEKLLRELGQLRRRFASRLNPGKPVVKHILLCATPTSRHNAAEYHDTVAEVENDYPGMVLPHVRHSGVTAKQYRRQATPPVTDPKSRATTDYEAVADALGFPDLYPDES